MRTLPAAAVLCASALLLTGCSTTSTSTGSGTNPSAQKTAEPAAHPILTKPNRADDLLFVARSKKAVLDVDSDGNGTLSLPAATTMTWFSDRPEHDAGTTTTTDALAAFGWKKAGDTLGAAAPNGALTADNLPQAVVVELTTATRIKGGVKFSVTAETQIRTKSSAKKPTKVPTRQRAHPVDLTNAELFIDSVAPEDCADYAAQYGVGSQNLQRVVAFFGGTNAHAPVMITGNIGLEYDGTQFASLVLYGYTEDGGDTSPENPNVSPYKVTLTETKPELRGDHLNLDGVDLEPYHLQFVPATDATDQTPAKAGYLRFSAQSGYATFMRDFASYTLPC
jgi:hypothetical protein